MARQARGEIIDPAEIQIVHCMHRCVRQALLCGNDPYSGKCYEHRRQWIVDRIKLMCSVFAIDLCAYAIMNNHYHIVVRIDVDASLPCWR